MATDDRLACDEKSRLRAALSLAWLGGDKKRPGTGPGQRTRAVWEEERAFRLGGGAGYRPPVRYLGEWHHPDVNAGYSRSSAWMGSSLAARRAGAKPKITPIRLAQRQAIPMAGRE